MAQPPVRRSIAAKALAAAFCAALAGCAARNVPAALHGTPYQPPRPAPAIALPATTGSTFTLAHERGDLVILYFGFTHCKDVCPQTLAHVDRAVKRARTPNARIIFITVDPRRDTLAAERAFFARAAVRTIGLTGTQAQLAPIWKAYGVAIAPESNDVVHSDYIYIVDPHGRLRELLHSDIPIAELADDLRTLAAS